MKKTINDNYYFIENVNWKISLIKKWDENDIDKYVFLNKIEKIYEINWDIYIFWINDFIWKNDNLEDEKFLSIVFYKYWCNKNEIMEFTEEYKYNKNRSYVNTWQWGWESFKLSEIDPVIEKNTWNVLFAIYEEEIDSDWVFSEYLKWFNYNEKDIEIELINEKDILELEAENYTNKNVNLIDFENIEIKQIKLYFFNIELDVTFTTSYSVKKKETKINLIWLIDDYQKKFLEKRIENKLDDHLFDPYISDTSATKIIEIENFINNKEIFIKLKNSDIKKILDNLKIVDNSKEFEIKIQNNLNLYKMNFYI